MAGAVEQGTPHSSWSVSVDRLDVAILLGAESLFVRRDAEAFDARAARLVPLSPETTAREATGSRLCHEGWVTASMVPAAG